MVYLMLHSIPLGGGIAVLNEMHGRDNNDNHNQNINHSHNNHQTHNNNRNHNNTIIVSKLLTSVWTFGY